MVPGRYALLANFVREVVSRGLTADTFRMVEVGTWNGSRAIQMANAAFEAGADEVRGAALRPDLTGRRARADNRVQLIDKENNLSIAGFDIIQNCF